MKIQNIKIEVNKNLIPLIRFVKWEENNSGKFTDLESRGRDEKFFSTFESFWELFRKSATSGELLITFCERKST